jgi:hypothetical protein
LKRQPVCRGSASLWRAPHRFYAGSSFERDSILRSLTNQSGQALALILDRSSIQTAGNVQQEAQGTQVVTGLAGVRAA